MMFLYFVNKPILVVILISSTSIEDSIAIFSKAALALSHSGQSGFVNNRSLVGSIFQDIALAGYCLSMCPRLQNREQIDNVRTVA